jgi:hypothetical protein
VWAGERWEEWVAEEERKYETRYCAFLDILGFADLIGNIGKDGLGFEVVRDLLRKIHEPSKFDTAGTADFRATTVSDAIALSSSYSANGLAVLVDAIVRLVLGALEEGYFMRGGLCRGLLYHDDEMVFGDAFIKAYRLESSVARYPRVMVTKQVYEEAITSNVGGYFRTHLIQAEDGPYFVDVLEHIRTELKIIDSGSAPQVIVEQRLPTFAKMRDQIARRLGEAADNPNHFEKAQWFAAYWNAAFFGETRMGRITGPGLVISLGLEA